ncbi:MAG TPA: single-stranded DNA-binding protein [Actinomycetes bacterium]|nr:single-stranded DNA-binding protein [Actinomycetes bacterium]
MARSKTDSDVATAAADQPELQQSWNEVSLAGRVAADPVATTLPSGDVVVSVRVIVDRDSRARQPPTVDTIDCAGWTARARRSMLAWHTGDFVSLEGALRRRFWRSTSGAQSRYEVEVLQAKRLRRGD